VAKRQLSKRSAFPSLRAYVDSFPRTVRQYEIAKTLGISESLLSRYLRGTAPSSDVALRLSRDHGISLEGLLDPSGTRVGAA
jgi:predicted transcriptional regulator